MPDSGYYIWSLDGQPGLRPSPTTPVLCTRNPFLPKGGTSPWKSTAARNCFIRSMPVLSLTKVCHPPQTLFVSHPAGPSAEAARGSAPASSTLTTTDTTITLHLLTLAPLLTPSTYQHWPGSSRDHSHLTSALLRRAPTRDQTSKISSPTGVRISYPSSVTTTVFSTPTAPSPGNTTLGSREKTMPSSRG